MLGPEQFARVRLLFDQISALPTQERAAALAGLDADPEVMDELRALLAHTDGSEGRYANPLAEAIIELLPDASVSGDVLGAWTLLDEIGHGGMGKVYRARRSDGHFDQTAAVKVIGGLPSARALRYLARERQILATLSHPGIARLLDGGNTSGGQPYFVMEYVDGKPIHRYCDDHDLDTRSRIKLLIDVCDAVSFAHQHLIVHCDLKPSNILVTEQGRPILLDFGISRQLMEADIESHDPGVMGSSDATATSKAYTPRYASPEQVAGERVGTATDIYGLGLILAELLGADWEAGESPNVKHLPRDLAAIIARATHEAPKSRYPGAGALASDLRRLLSHRPVRAREPGSAYIAGKWLRRNWSWVATGLVFVATILTFSWNMRVQRDHALQAERAARAVTSYLASVFQGADPEMSGQRDLPVSQLLDAGRDRLAEQLADQPRVHAQLAAILGGVYQTLGKREQAKGLFDRGLGLLEGGADAPVLYAELLHRKAFTTYDQEDFAAAEPLARQALALREVHEPNTRNLVDSLRLVGSVLTYRGAREEASHMLQRALRLADSVTGPGSVLAGKVHLDLGRHHVSTDLVGTNILEHGREARRIFEQHVGPDHFLYVNALEVMAFGHTIDGNLDEALPLARSVAEQRIELYGEVSYQAGYGLYGYAYMLDSAGRRLEALPVAERCLEIQQHLDGQEALSSTVPRRLLGDLQQRVGRYAVARETYGKVLELHARLQPEDTRTIAAHQLRLGATLRQMGEIEVASDQVSAALATYLDDPATIPLHRVRAQIEMAAVLREQGKLDEAVAMLDTVDPAALKGNPWETGKIERERALIAGARGQAAEAAEAFRSAETIVVDAFGEDHADAWLFRLPHAQWLARIGESEAASALAASIAEHAATSISPDGDLARRIAALVASHP